MFLDFLRCSVTYDDAGSLLNGLREFEKSVSNKSIKCLLAIKRVKNGFKFVPNWKSFKDSEYCDVKFNVIYQSPFDDKQCQLVEIQFLLKPFLKAKKMGHKWYNIQRRRNFIESVDNIINETYNDYENCKKKIRQMVKEQNINQFAKELILRPNIGLSAITSFVQDGTPHNVPLFYLAALSNNSKMYTLFLDCLFHYNDKVLGQTYKKDKDKFWLKKYFNFSNCAYNQTFGIRHFVKYTVLTVQVNLLCVFTDTMYIVFLLNNYSGDLKQVTKHSWKQLKELWNWNILMD